MSKILERAILNKLSAVIGQKIHSEQSAFRPQHLTTHQLAKLFDHLYLHSNHNEDTLAIFLDVEKAFDSVWHDGFKIYKMLQVDPPLNLCRIIQCFLSNRLIKIWYNNIISSNISFTANMPQSSCLSPTIYNFYTNNMPINANASLTLFANDTLVYTKNRNIYWTLPQVQKQTNTILDCFHTWHTWNCKK